MTFDGIPVAITRKNIKSINRRIKPPDGRIEISCPKRMTNAQIEAFVCEKADWIREHRAKILALDLPEEKQYITGESVSVWGRNLPLIVKNGSPSLCASADSVILTVPEGTPAEQRKACIDAWYRENLHLAVEKRMPYWENRTGLKCSRWSIRDMKTRWGSCTHRTAAIRVNLRLAEKPPECLDYLLLHELTHIRHPNHSKDFYDDIAKLMPDWKHRRMILNGKNDDE